MSFLYSVLIIMILYTVIMGIKLISLLIELHRIRKAKPLSVEKSLICGGNNYDDNLQTESFCKALTPEAIKALYELDPPYRLTEVTR